MKHFSFHHSLVHWYNPCVAAATFALHILWSLDFLEQQSRTSMPSKLVSLIQPRLEIRMQEEEILSTNTQILWLQMVPPRGCAYVVMGQRQDALRGLVSLKNARVNSNLVKVSIHWSFLFLFQGMIKDEVSVSTCLFIHSSVCVLFIFCFAQNAEKRREKDKLQVIITWKLGVSWCSKWTFTYPWEKCQHHDWDTKYKATMGDKSGWENDTSRYWSTCSILFASSVNSQIP